MPLTSGAVSLTSASATQIVVAGAVATGGSGTYTYQWLRSNDGGSTWANVSGATTASSVTDTASLVAGRLYYYGLQSTDTGVSPNQIVVSNVVSALAWGGFMPQGLPEDSSPYNALAVDISSTDQALASGSRGIWVGGVGDVKVDMLGGSLGITFAGVPAGQFLVGHFTKVYKTGTTATSMVAVW